MRHDPRSHWNRRHTARPEVMEPARFVSDSAHLLPESGTALDVAGGTGRNALWLAASGLTTTLIDVSDVALDLARTEAERRGLALEVIRCDIESSGLPDGTWDVIVVHFFLARHVLSALPDRLNPGGIAIVAHPTVRNLEANPRPQRRYLLYEGELAAIASDWEGVEIITLEESCTSEDRHEARLRVRKR